MGTGGGDLHIYSFRKDGLFVVDFFSPGTEYSISEDKPVVALLETKKAFTRRSIDQLGFIKDTNSLVILSGVYYALYHSYFFNTHCPRQCRHLVRFTGAVPGYAITPDSECIRFRSEYCHSTRSPGWKCDVPYAWTQRCKGNTYHYHTSCRRVSKESYYFHMERWGSTGSQS